VIDAERGELICSYDNCAYSGRDRAPLASDPENPNMAICGCTNGKGIITFDLRKQQPAHFALNVHASLIKDIIYLNSSWPYGDNHQATVVSLSCDGVCKIRTVDDRVLDVFDVKHRSSCVAATPDDYCMYAQEGFESMLMIGGDCLSEYLPAPLGLKSRLYDHGPNDKPIYKLKYTSNGHLLYAIASGGQVRRYRRIGREHQLLGEVYSHNDEVSDMDISPNDEYIVTASRDGNVGLLCLGAPSFGWTGFMELA
jgi:WD40 repeat protein